MKTLKAWNSVILGMAVAASSVGCSRSFWRQQADTDTYEAITEHLTDQRWAVPRIDITPDPRSRFFDPYDPDAAPLPPDDPAAHVYMHWVDGWEGYKCWHQFGDQMSVENPQWLVQFGHTPEMVDEETGAYIAGVPKMENVALPQAVELAQIHNRDYQFELENLFLNALDVTFERYQLGVRYLEPTGGISETIVEGGGSGRFNVNSIGLSQSLPWGTQLVASLANTTLWSFGAGGQSSSVSTMSFQILQPLLNDAGRKVNLENLTQVERSLLYQARDLARFRKELFTDIVSDYLGLAQQIQGVENERGNIVRLEEQVERLLAENQPESISVNVEVAELGADFMIPPELRGKLDYRLRRLIWTGLMSPAEEKILRNLRPGAEFQEKIDALKDSLPSAASGLDVLRLQFTLANSVNRLRLLEQRLQDRLDNFKVSLGLPPDMEMTIDQSLLKPFEVIDPLLTLQEAAINEFILRLYVEDAIEQESLRTIALGFRELLTNVRRDVVEIIGVDLKQFQNAIPKRLAALENPIAQAQLQADFVQARDRYSNFEKKFRGFETETATLIEQLQQDDLNEETRIAIFERFEQMRQDLLLTVQSSAVIQISSRVELIEIAKFDMPLKLATTIAIEQRLDLMNARARVMDARRGVEVIANQLKSVLDIGLDGSMSTPGGKTNPFDFRSDSGQLTASLSFDTPLDQINERNAYREALIRYQRERRNYMAAEDRVKSDIRIAWRQMNVFRQNLETSRLATRIGAMQYESAVSDGSAPIDPRQASSRSSGVQGQNLTFALNAILSAQNQLITNYVGYERNRLNIYRDMGIMEIGPDGIWNDKVYRNLDKTNDEDNNSTEIRKGDNLDRGVGRVSLVNGNRLRDEAGVVELRHLLGQFQPSPNEPVTGEGRAGTVSGQFVGAGKSR